MLEAFLTGHNPFRSARKGQYRSAIFYADEQQRLLAEEAMERIASGQGERPATGVEPHSGFTLAEDYHQKYVLRRSSAVLDELTALYPGRAGFLASTAVTRANAFLGRNASPERVREDLPRMGLSAEAARLLDPEGGA